MTEEVHITVDVEPYNVTVAVPSVPSVVVAGSSGGGGEGGAVTSVNGQDGVVVLDAGDVGADPAGTAAAAVAALGDAAALDVGTTAGTVAAGNDSRLTDARTPTGGAGGVLSGTYPNPGFAVDMVEQTELTSALAGYQPLDSDLTAIAALATTTYGRAFLALADAAAGRTALGLGTAALSASGDFQPVDSDLTAIAALSTTSYGRSLLTSADVAALRDALDADDRRPFAVPFGTFHTSSGTITAPTANPYITIAASAYVEWTQCTFVKGTWRFMIQLATQSTSVGSTVQLSVGGTNLGTAVNTYEASGAGHFYTVDTDKVFSTRTLAAVRWTASPGASTRGYAWAAWRVD